MSHACTRVHSDALSCIRKSVENGVPEGNRTPDPRFRKRYFRASQGYKGVHAGAKASTGFAKKVGRHFMNARERTRICDG